MKKTIASLHRDCDGASAIEFAIAGPLIVLLMLGILQFRILLLARSGMSHAVEAGARYATTYIYTESRVPTCTEIRDKVLTKGFGMNPGHVTGPAVRSGISHGSPYVDIEMTFAMPLNFVFFQTEPVALRYTRRAFQVHLQSKGSCSVN